MTGTSSHQTRGPERVHGNRRTAAAVLTFGLCLHALWATPASAQADGLDHFRVESCPLPFENKVWTALNYIYQATSVGPELPRCLEAAQNGGKSLTTRQEFTAVGPYVPCNTSNPAVREDAIYYANPGAALGRANAYLTDAFRPGYPAPIKIICSSSSSPTAWTNDWYWAGHRNAITIYLGLRTQITRPSHEQLSVTGPDIGPNFSYVEVEESYPVDELAGIIAHEILHTHKFSHGDSANQCGYTSYECSGSQPGVSCRANSAPEIMEACVSEVVEASVKQCSWNIAPFAQPGGTVTRVTPVVYQAGTCSYEASLRPRDRIGYLPSTFEASTDRMGLDYAAIGSASAGDCRQACVDNTACRAFTFVPSTSTCWLKSGVPSPTPASTLSSGFVRTNMFGGSLEYNVDRPGGVVIETYITSLMPYCAKRCNDYPDCRYARFKNNAGPGGGSGECTLLSSAPSAAVTSVKTVTYIK